MTRDKLKELRARAVHGKAFRFNAPFTMPPFEDKPQFWLDIAEATMKAEADAGLVNVREESLLCLLEYAADLNMHGPLECRWDSRATPDWFVELAAAASGIVQGTEESNGNL